MENKESFTFTYSAGQQDEIKKIRQKYIPQEADKMEQLRRLDRSVTRKSTMISIITGVIGALLLGTGMSCTMLWAETLFIVGIIVGVAGIVPIAAAYPLFIYITKREREKIAPEIIRLTDELMK